MTTSAKTRPNRRHMLAVAGEEVALVHLRSQGMELLHRNWRCDLGELDLVLREGRTLVVCEVKTRRSEAFGHPLLAIDARKLARLRHLAARYALEAEATFTGIRLDAIGIVWPRGGEPVLRHIEAVGR